MFKALTAFILALTVLDLILHWRKNGVQLICGHNKDSSAKAEKGGTTVMESQKSSFQTKLTFRLWSTAYSKFYPKEFEEPELIDQWII